MALRRFTLVALMCACAHAATPVVVELFTSEGCSDCPPADVLLAKLTAAQPVPGVEIIALSEHVDYWDHQGWRDPFSSSQFTARQEQYCRALRDRGPYTPEMVVDGAIGFVGNQSAQALAAIKQAAAAPKTVARITPGASSVRIQVDAVPREADVWLAITESNLLSSVSAGENAGRKLAHASVVRSLRVVGKTRPAEPFSAEARMSLAKTWKPADLRAVVLVQERSTHRIVGAAETPLAKP